MGMKWWKGHQARTASPCLLSVRVLAGDSCSGGHTPKEASLEQAKYQILDLELRLRPHCYQARKDEARLDYFLSFFEFLLSWGPDGVDKIKKLTLCFIGNFHFLYPASMQTSHPVTTDCMFFNPCFLQCIPVTSVSCKCFVSDHPALHKGLVERKSIQARNVLTIRCWFSHRGLWAVLGILCRGFSTSSVYSHFSAGCIFPQICSLRSAIFTA